ncbi:MAG TPA: response regulator transcription factor [Oligoflexus sp.]|uniref:response regulator transcription factor n=1 Tax=Oligoflexus sp. TaxID=1971216 RepID=UPI002D7FFB30|nr:response regulator transcription factor [Oligoflexus sp.]HET9237840.1 response regulator transcription factor [Oligoflexus sp.]
MSESKTFCWHGSLCLLVEDQPQFGAFLQQAVELAFPGIKVIRFMSLRETRMWLDATRISSSLQFALIDLGLPDGSGVELIRELSARWPEVLNVVVTIFREDSCLFEAIAAGAFGYILKDECQDLMVDTLRRLQRREPPISPSIARRLLAHFQSPRLLANPSVHLTAREKQTLTLLVRGFTVAEVAKHLALSPQTVSGYVKIIHQKLHVSNRAEAVREALRLGLV